MHILFSNVLSCEKISIEWKRHLTKGDINIEAILK